MKPIEITFPEAILLDGLFPNEKLSPETFIEIGRVINSEKPRLIPFYEQEVWLLRQWVPFFAAVGGIQVGAELKKKVYATLGEDEITKDIGISMGNIEEPKFDIQLFQASQDKKDKEKEGEDGLCAV